MNFLSPIFLLGLPLVAIPVVIHLLSRRRKKVIDWGAMEFLLSGIQRRRRLWKLNDLILLLLRVLTLFLIVGALSRPLLPVTWLGGSGPREVVMILDQSMSMSQQVGEQTLFDLQIEQANAILDEISPTDTIRVLLAGETQRWLTPGPVDGENAALRRIRAQIEQLQPTLGSANLSACIHEVLDLEPPKDKMVRLMSVITDGQKYSWRWDETQSWTEIENKMQASNIPAIVNVQILDSKQEHHLNLAVDRLGTHRALTAVSQPQTFTAAIGNRGTVLTEPTLLHWYVDDRSIGLSSIPALEPGAGTTVTLNHSIDQPGVVNVSCRLEINDDLPADNEGYLILEIAESIPILIVEGNPSRDPLVTEIGYLLAALGYSSDASEESPWRSVFVPTIISPEGLGAASLSKYHCVVLANTETLSPENVQALSSFVESGGGSWMVLGDRTDPDFFNETLYRKGRGSRQ